MTKKPNPHPEASSPPLSLEKVEKGSHRSMWDLLLQLRVLLPYIARLVPLLDRGKTGPDITELSKGIATIQISTRDLEVQARNQALHLERIEQQVGQLRAVHENSLDEARKLVAEVSALRRVFLILAVVMAVLLGATVGMVTYLVARS